MARKTGSRCYTFGTMPSLYITAVKVLYILGSPMHRCLLTALVLNKALRFNAQLQEIYHACISVCQAQRSGQNLHCCEQHFLVYIYVYGIASSIAWQC